LSANQLLHQRKLQKNSKKMRFRRKVQGPEYIKSKKWETPAIVYSHDEAVEESIQYFNGDELAARVWANKYALKDSFGNLYEKTPDDMHHRIAREIHRIELRYKIHCQKI